MTPQWLVDLSALAEFAISFALLSWLIGRWRTRRDRIAARRRNAIVQSAEWLAAQRERGGHHAA